MKFDLHTHHFRCGHAIGSIRDYIEAAVQRGLQVIGISDHSPYFCNEEDYSNPNIAMAISQFPAYVDEVLALKKEYSGKIEILLGVESDFFPEYIEKYRQIYNAWPLDYIIGSVHHSNGLSIFDKNRWVNMQEKEITREKEIYFTLIQQSVKSKLFDILGHIDALGGFFPSLSKFQTPVVDQTLQIISDNEGVIEINTSGKNKDCGGWHPTDEILERACFYGVNVTFGSDAHVPERVGDDLEAVQKRLKEIGFKEWIIFKNRKRHTFLI